MKGNTIYSLFIVLSVLNAGLYLCKEPVVVKLTNLNREDIVNLTHIIMISFSVQLSVILRRSLFVYGGYASRLLQKLFFCNILDLCIPIYSIAEN